ncbi:MAG: type II toxin-antitoxin system PemK/MazF family toxin [Alphaproteobacteria bacterium]|nr:type II toxin-antitoxin system PemK/MazF family toxin [Alphaproteobacteria bacterium]MCB9694594.1 type II toxin-antitoxin system PemK/MazF family toxin [Alphaproteobacteria bacterium]
MRQGDLFWATLPRHPATPALPHPHLVLQDDALNASRVDTVVVCALTSNVRRANEPANVLLDPGEGDLPQRSVIVVSQVASVPWSALGPHIGRLSPSRVQEVFQGLRLLASLTG